MAMEKEDQPFLQEWRDHQEHDDNNDVDPSPPLLFSQVPLRFYVLVAASTALFFCITAPLTILLFGARVAFRASSSSQNIDSWLFGSHRFPMEYHTKRPPYDAWANPLLFGEPSLESERAWNELLRPIGLRLSPEEANNLHVTTTTMLPDGDYVVIPAVMHNLHCLRRVRQTLQAKHYYSHFNPEQLLQDKHHTLHCLEAVRSSIMCRPDLTLLQFYFSGSRYHDLSARPNVSTTCVNWDTWQSVREARTYDHNELNEYHKQGPPPVR